MHFVKAEIGIWHRSETTKHLDLLGFLWWHVAISLVELAAE